MIELVAGIDEGQVVIFIIGHVSQYRVCGEEKWSTCKSPHEG